MTCGPVLIQWLAAVGLAAYGSVLLASVPPASMYMRPIFPAGGVWWCRYASIHAPAFLSQHIGSGPGVSGLSGMHVKPSLPLRSVRIPPFGSGATMVASSATFLGAAFMALAISSSSVGCVFRPVSDSFLAPSAIALSGAACRQERCRRPAKPARRVSSAASAGLSFRAGRGAGRKRRTDRQEQGAPNMVASNVATLSELEHGIQLRRAVIAATVGTAIEWYDFFLYSVVTGLVFAQLYFPKSDPLVGTLEAFTIYAVGFLARPIGAAIFGHFGDRIGRKSTLIATLLVMGIATFLVALVPTYEQIGIWGAVILTVLRFIQGIGVGGEWGGSVLMAMEWARSNRSR